MGAHGLADAARSVADERVGSCDPPHGASPVLRVLGPREVTAYDMVICAGDEDGRPVASKPYPVHAGDIVSPHGRTAARKTPETLFSRLGRSVLEHLGATDGAFWVRRRSPLLIADFFSEKARLNRRVKSYRYTPLLL